MAKASRTPLIIVGIVCTALVLLSVVGAGIYMHRQDIAQRDRALQQEKQLKEYEQAQINKRSELDNKAESTKCNTGQSYDWFSGRCQ